MDVVTAVVAIVGAVTGSLSLYLYWTTTRTRLELEVNPGTALVQSGADPYGNAIESTAAVVFIQITNKSPHRVKISNLSAVDADDEQKGFLFPRPYPTHIKVPIEIDARDSVIVWVNRDSGLESRRLRFQVRTSAKEDFQTRPLVLEQLPAFEMLQPGSS